MNEAQDANGLGCVRHVSNFLQHCGKPLSFFRVGQTPLHIATMWGSVEAAQVHPQAVKHCVIHHPFPGDHLIANGCWAGVDLCLG